MPVRTRNSLCTYALEATYGVAPASGYKALDIVRDPSVTPLAAEQLGIESVRPWHGADAVRLINRTITIEMQIRVSGSGVAGTPPQYGGLLTCGAMTETVVASTSVAYSLGSLSSAIPSATCRWYVDGMVHQLTGARCNVTLAGTVGEFMTFTLAITGIYSRPAKSAMVTAVFEDQAPPLEISAINTPTVTINSVACCLAAFNLDMGMAVNYESYGGCVQQIDLGDRVPSGSIEVEAKLPGAGAGEQDFMALVDSHQQVPITIVHGVTAGNILTVTQPTCQLMPYTPSDRNGKQFFNFPIVPIRTAAATSEIVWTFT